MLSEVTVVT